ncbi:hypothetical protein JAAARDRAFT_116380, partial [Jaapia argillacea MUCL 33604]
FLDKGDAASTGNMIKHVKSCWGEYTYRHILGNQEYQGCPRICEDLQGAGLIDVTFEKKGGGKICYSHQQHTKTEAKVEIVRWLAESLQPFKIVKDCGFQWLMKTGRPEYYILSPSTILRDVHWVFANCWQRMAKMMRVSIRNHVKLIQ